MDTLIASACESVPGLLLGALVLLPDALAIGGVGAGSVFDREPLVRSAVCCLIGVYPARLTRTPFVEYTFVANEQLVVIVRSERHEQLALALACSCEGNIALVLSATRQALRTIEAAVNLAEWGLG